MLHQTVTNYVVENMIGMFNSSLNALRFVSVGGRINSKLWLKRFRNVREILAKDIIDPLCSYSVSL